jgi:hypothetical protein
MNNETKTTKTNDTMDEATMDEATDTRESPETSEETDMSEETTMTPGDQLRALPTEAQQRGTRFVSAQAMQARLFSVYDAAAAAEDALALVQQQLTLTLNRSYYEADEIETMATELDSLLALESMGLTEGDLGLDAELTEEDLGLESELVSEE